MATTDSLRVSSAPESAPRASRTPESSLGRWLKQEREVRQISLEEIAQTTRIPIRTLQGIEDDRFEALPGDVFVRGFLRSYARAVGISPDAVLERFDARKAPAPQASQAAPITTITPPERGRRFGIAIALVILLILFTLALSIVLRPRHRDAPVELSRATGAAATTLSLRA